MRSSVVNEKVAEDCRTPKPSDIGAPRCIAKRLGVRQSSAAFNRRAQKQLRHVICVFALTGICSCAASAQQRANMDSGLVVSFRSVNSPNRAHSSVAPQIGLYVAQGGTPSPFVPNGPFTAKWDGYVNADLRGEFFFRAEANGAFELKINGKPVLQLTNHAGETPALPVREASALSEAVQLNKGANPLTAVFKSPGRGDAWVRLGWTEKGTNTSPIPRESLMHAATPELARDEQLALGRELFLEHRCIKCHAAKLSSGAPELSMDPPSFEGIGARRQSGWMARWILHPKSQRSDTRMPEVLHGENAEAEAQAIAAYLGTLRTESEPALQPLKPLKHNAEPSPALFEKLLCAACHTAPDYAGPPTNKVALAQVATKFQPGKLAHYLLMPERDYAWTRMPNFRLTESEAKALAQQLLAAAPKEQMPTPDSSLTTKGNELVQTRGCLNCHSLAIENKFRTKPLEALSSVAGCLGVMSSASPAYGFSTEERAALQAFLKTGIESLDRQASAEFAERQTRILNCTACHSQQEGFPPLPILGGKLRPEWSAAFIAGEIPYKPRAETHPKGEVWLEARMPAFRARAKYLAEGLAAQHGFGAHTAPNPKPDPELVKIGQKLVGKDGGFSCVSCHAVGSVAAADVFESEGINFIYSAERLLPDYYRRWVRNPLSIDPQTKMPMYFEEGRSPLTEILDGDAEKQIDAIWNYLLLGAKMPPPNTGEAQ